MSEKGTTKEVVLTTGECAADFMGDSLAVQDTCPGTTTCYHQRQPLHQRHSQSEPSPSLPTPVLRGTALGNYWGLAC